MILRLALVVAALAAALVPLPSPWVESLYSTRAYPALQRAVTTFSNGASFALFDLLLLAAAIWVISILFDFARRWRQRGFLRAVVSVTLRTVGLAAAVYLAFLLLWGFNYRRTPMTSRVAYSRDAITPEATLALARRTVARANALAEPVHRAGWPAWRGMPSLLGPSFARVQRQLGRANDAVPGVPKWSVATYYFERSGVEGMTDPIFLETLVNWSVLPFERPAIVAHEWAHLAGYADESEANFVGWIVCLQGPPAAEYSGQLSLVWQLLPALGAREREVVVRDLDPRVRADLKAIAERVSKATPVVRRVSWRVYDRYLRANRVAKGVASYDAALELMLGTRFAEGWVPVLRNEQGNPR